MDQRDKDRIVWNLKSLPNELEDLLSGIDDDTFRWKPIPNKWSLKEIMCHLRDMEEMAYLNRYQRILAEDTPQLPNIDQDRLAYERDYINQDARAALEDFKRFRAETIRTLEAAPPDAWSRAGIHEQDGPMTIEQLVVRQIKGNDLNHLVQMKDIIRLKNALVRRRPATIKNDGELTNAWRYKAQGGSLRRQVRRAHKRDRPGHRGAAGDS